MNRDKKGRYARQSRWGMLLAIAVLATAGVVALNNSNKITAENKIIEERMVEVQPEWAEDPDAVEAAQAVIRKKELEAELENLNAEVAEREARIEEIEKELNIF